MAVHSRLVDVDGRKLAITGDGKIYRVRAEVEVGLEPRGREPSANEKDETKVRGFWGASAREKRQPRRAPAADR